MSLFIKNKIAFPWWRFFTAPCTIPKLRLAVILHQFITYDKRLECDALTRIIAMSNNSVPYCGIFLFLCSEPKHIKKQFSSLFFLSFNFFMWKMAQQKEKPFLIHILMFAAIKLFIFRIETQLFVSIFVTPEQSLVRI